GKDSLQTLQLTAQDLRLLIESPLQELKRNGWSGENETVDGVIRSRLDDPRKGLPDASVREGHEPVDCSLGAGGPHLEIDLDRSLGGSEPGAASRHCLESPGPLREIRRVGEVVKDSFGSAFDLDCLNIEG